MMETSQQLADHEARIASLERRDEARADEMIAISALAGELRREKDERADESAKMIGSIQRMFDARQTPQDLQLEILAARTAAQDQARRMQVIAALPGVVVLVLGMWQRMPTEGTIALAGAVWLAMRQALGGGASSSSRGGGGSLPPSKL